MTPRSFYFSVRWLLWTLVANAPLSSFVHGFVAVPQRQRVGALTVPDTVSASLRTTTMARCQLLTLHVSRTTNNDHDKKVKPPVVLSDMEDGTTTEDSTNNLQVVSLGSLIMALTAFILVNQFVGPWPLSVFRTLPPPAWLLLHYLGGVLFAGGIVVSAALEWLVVETTAAAAANNSNNNNKMADQDNTKNGSSSSSSMGPVLDFLFQRVPVMDAALVVPGLALALVSGVAVSAAYYNGLATAPPHIVWAFRVLVAFAIWWAVTDVATQGPAVAAVEAWKRETAATGELPEILYHRRLSNIGSCLFVVALYALMALKPGTYEYF